MPNEREAPAGTDSGNGAISLRYMDPSRYRPAPAEAEDLLRLADILCAAACEICNQGTPAAPYDIGDGQPIPQQVAPEWAFDDLSQALNAYYEARHLPPAEPTGG